MGWQAEINDDAISLYGDFVVGCTASGSFRSDVTGHERGEDGRVSSSRISLSEFDSLPHQKSPVKP